MQELIVKAVAWINICAYLFICMGIVDSKISYKGSLIMIFVFLLALNVLGAAMNDPDWR